MQHSSSQVYKEPFPPRLLPARPFIHLCDTNLTPRTPVPQARVIPGCRQGMGSDRAARQRFLSSLRREAFCKVTARNPPIMGIKITQPISRARGRHSEEPLCSSGTNTPGHLLSCGVGGGRAWSPALCPQNGSNLTHGACSNTSGCCSGPTLGTIQRLLTPASTSHPWRHLHPPIATSSSGMEG